MNQDDQKKQQLDQFQKTVGMTGPVEITEQLNEEESPGQQETEGSGSQMTVPNQKMPEDQQQDTNQQK